MRRISFSFYLSHFGFSYQSTKYNQPTATSEAVIVTLENSTAFEVKQTTAREFRVVFNGAVDALDKKDVTVELIDAVNANFKVPCLIESVTLDADKKGATVKLYTQFTDAAMYQVTIKDVDHTFVASNGLPVDIKMSINPNNPDDMIVPAGSAHKLIVRFYDAAGILLEMGSNAPTVYLSTDQYDKCILSYEGSDNTILFTEAGATATINATCSGYIGNTEINIKKDFTFYSRVPDAVVVTVTDKTLGSTPWSGNLSTPFDDEEKLVIKVHYSDQASWQKEEIKDLTDVYGDGRYMFKLVALNPNVAAISTDMTITKFMAPSGNDLAAGFILKAVTKDANGAWTVETPIDVITIPITKARNLNSATLDRTLVSVGNTETSKEERINLNVKDQYGANYAVTSSWPNTPKYINDTFECLDNNDLAKEVISAGEIYLDKTVNSGMGQIVVTCGPKMKEVLAAATANGQKSVQLRYRLTIQSPDYSVTKSVTFSVRIQDIKQDADSKNVALVKFSGDVSGNVGRYAHDWDDGIRATTTCTIKAYQMKDGLKLREQEVDYYPSNVNEAEAGKYYVQLMKNNQDITNSWNRDKYLSVSGSSVTLTFSQLADIMDNNYVKGSNGQPVAVSGGALGGAQKVTYDLGAGNIAVYLWQAVEQNGKVVLNRVASAAPVIGTTTVDIGKYNGYRRLTEVIDGSSINQESVRACFEVKDRNNNVTGAKYVVDYSYKEGSDYVFVQRIRFYEEVNSLYTPGKDVGQYAEYIVDINESLKVQK